MSVRKRILPSGATKWLVDYRDRSGKRRAKQFPTKAAAVAWRDATGVAVRSGVHVPDSTAPTIKVMADSWLKYIEAEVGAGRMEKTTEKAYGQLVRLHICDIEIGVGSVKTINLTKAVVADFKDRLLKSRSSAMTRKSISVLALIMDYAIRHDRAAVNNARGIVVKRADRKKSRPTMPSPAQVKSLINNSTGDFRIIIMTAVFCGLRPSELWGLTWENVIFAKGIIRVRQRADRYGKIGDPKSLAADREVPFGPALAKELKALKLKSKFDLVFANSVGNPRQQNNILNREFRPLMKTLGLIDTDDKLEFRFYDLRHFAISHWIEQGFNAKKVQTWAGHSSIKVTFDIYGHLFPDSADTATGIEAIEGAVLGAGSAG